MVNYPIQMDVGVVNGDLRRGGRGRLRPERLQVHAAEHAAVRDRHVGTYFRAFLRGPQPSRRC
jgi:hypothetical protein